MLGRLHMGVEECINSWVGLSKRIFQPKHRTLDPRNITDFIKAKGRFDAKVLETEMKKIIKEKLSQSYNLPKKKHPTSLEEALLWDHCQADDGCKVFVCAIKGEDSHPVFLRSYSNETRSDHYSANMKIWEACRATSAATMFFDQFEKVSQGVTQVFFDGAFAYNNPVSRVYQEAIDLWGSRESLLISIGTGGKPDSSMMGGLKGLFAGILEIALSTEKEDTSFKEAHSKMVEAGLFYRFNVPWIGQIGIDNHERLDIIYAATTTYLDGVDTIRIMGICVEKAIEEVGLTLQVGLVSEPESSESLSLDHDRRRVEALLRSIYKHTYQYGEFLGSIPTPLDKTGEWLFKNQSYKTWRDLDEPTVLWVTANPGCGKTVTAKEAIKRLDESQSGRMACHFFFKSGNANQTEWSHALCSLLHQFISKENKLSEVVFPDYDIKGDRLFTEVSTLWNLLLGVVSRARDMYQRVYCVIDALDESEPDTQNLARKDLRRLTVAEGIKFLVTSRPNINIQQRNLSLSVMRVKGEDEVASLTSDISTVIDEEVIALGEEYDLSPQNRELLKQKLKGKSGRTFLWVSLVFKVLRAFGNTSMAWKSINSKLDEIPKDLEDLYAYALVQSPDIEETKKALSIILAARRPLLLEEFNIIFRAGPAKTLEELKTFLEPKSRVEFTARMICGVFIYIANGTVNLIHETAREFLLNRKASSDILGSNIKLVDAHAIIARTCITYLLIKDPYCVGGVAFFYAHSFWMDHDLESRRVSNDPQMDICSKYNLGEPREIDHMIAQLFDHEHPRVVSRHSIMLYNGPEDGSSWISFVMGAIWASNNRGMIVEHAHILLAEAIYKRHFSGAGLFFKFLNPDLIDGCTWARMDSKEWWESSGQDTPAWGARDNIENVDCQPFKRDLRQTIQLIVSSFQKEASGEQSGREAIQGLRDNLLRQRLSVSSYVWSLIYTFSKFTDRFEIQKKILLEWALIRSCGESWGCEASSLAQMVPPSARVYRAAIEFLYGKYRGPVSNEQVRDAIHKLGDRVEREARRHILVWLWEKAYEIGNHLPFQYFEKQSSVEYLVMRGVDEAWNTAMKKNNYNSAEYFYQKGAKRKLTAVLLETGIEGLVHIEKSPEVGPTQVIQYHPLFNTIIWKHSPCSVEEIHDTLLTMFAILVFILPKRFSSISNFSRSTKRDFQLRYEYNMRYTYGQDVIERVASIGRLSLETRERLSISEPRLYNYSLTRRLEPRFPWGVDLSHKQDPTLLGFDINIDESDDIGRKESSSDISNIFRLFLFYSIWIKSPQAEWLLERFSAVTGSSLNESDGNIIAVLAAAVGDARLLRLYAPEHQASKEIAQAQQILLASVLSNDAECCDEILRRTTPYLDLNAYFHHNENHQNWNIYVKSSWETWYSPGDGVLQLEERIRSFIAVMVFGNREFNLNPLGLAVYLRSYEVIDVLFKYGANPWASVDELAVPDLDVEFRTPIRYPPALDYAINIIKMTPEDLDNPTYRYFFKQALALQPKAPSDPGKPETTSQKSLLHYAIEDFNTPLVRLLLSEEADTSVLDSEGRTALHAAVMSVVACQSTLELETTLEILEAIVEKDKGKSYEERGKRSRTPYKLAETLRADNRELWYRVSKILVEAEFESRMIGTSIQETWEASLKEAVEQPRFFGGVVDEWMEVPDMDDWEDESEGALSD
ncbi:hypothetical protein TWF718_009224 [Orbilia javanica]|uniref:Nephrocystin 3-like N-terminal domain-containing protein n=1 Tax=Orbilia javanica TaxID=47235 RepID=A0AAN8RMC5_9PEZI